MGSSYSVPETKSDNNVIEVTLYYTPLDSKCLHHLEQFLELRREYKFFSIFRAVNVLSALKDVPPLVKHVPIYVIKRGLTVVTATPDGGILQHTLRKIASHVSDVRE